MAKVQAERVQGDDDLEFDPEATPVPSARPTSVPRFDIDVLASAAFRDGRSQSPLDIAIPVRTGRTPSEILHLRAAFLLLHVDGRSTIAQIAETADVPLSETITYFIELVGAGTVDLSGSALGLAVPQSGVHRRDEP